MGRPRKELDIQSMVQMLEDGIPQKETAEYLGVSVPTLKKVIDEIQQKEGILLNWRAVRSLQLTELQAAILSHITPAKMEEASLKDLVLAYKVLAEKEDEIENPEQKKMTGLVSYLIELEKRNYVLDQSGRTIDVTSRSEVEDAEGKVFDEYGEVPQF